jgi:hypothetical protein
MTKTGSGSRTETPVFCVFDPCRVVTEPEERGESLDVLAGEIGAKFQIDRNSRASFNADLGYIPIASLLAPGEERLFDGGSDQPERRLAEVPRLASARYFATAR